MTASFDDVPDSTLLHFDAKVLAGHDETSVTDFPDHARSLLRSEHRAIYRNHLLIAKWVDCWHDGLLEEGPKNEAFCQALKEIRAHLRQGDFVPNGGLWDDALSTLEDPS